MEEIWKDIKGFEGRYQVSNLGNIKSLRYCGRDEVKNLVPKVNNKGYEWVELWKNAKRNCRQVHRLVAEAFAPNPMGYPIVNHKDENPRNNQIDNLEWCDYQYNVIYSMKLHHRDKASHRPRKLGSYKHSRPVAQVDKDGNVVKIWKRPRDVEREEGKSQWSIMQCCDGKRKTAYGYTWHYADAI